MIIGGKVGFFLARYSSSIEEVVRGVYSINKLLWLYAKKIPVPSRAVAAVNIHFSVLWYRRPRDTCVTSNTSSSFLIVGHCYRI